jgi:hypothetical protein
LSIAVELKMKRKKNKETGKGRKVKKGKKEGEEDRRKKAGMVDGSVRILHIRFSSASGEMFTS